MENEQSWGGEEGKCVGGVQKYVNNNNISKMGEADQRVARILCIRGPPTCKVYMESWFLLDCLLDLGLSRFHASQLHTEGNTGSLRFLLALNISSHFPTLAAVLPNCSDSRTALAH